MKRTVVPSASPTTTAGSTQKGLAELVSPAVPTKKGLAELAPPGKLRTTAKAAQAPTKTRRTPKRSASATISELVAEEIVPAPPTATLPEKGLAELAFPGKPQAKTKAPAGAKAAGRAKKGLAELVPPTVATKKGLAELPPPGKARVETKARARVRPAPRRRGAVASKKPIAVSVTSPTPTAAPTAGTGAKVGGRAKKGLPEVVPPMGSARKGLAELVPPTVTTKKGLAELASPGGPAKTQGPPEIGFRIPPILLEGDEPTAPPVVRKPEPSRPVPPQVEWDMPEAGTLPEAYGTGALVLRARDPHWLYAYWDLAREHQRRYSALSADGQLALRVYRDVISGKPIEELRVHPESQHWFVHVQTAGAQYVAELGYTRPDGNWVAVSESLPVTTPPEGMSEDRTVQFVSVVAPRLPAAEQPGNALVAPPPPAAEEPRLALVTEQPVVTVRLVSAATAEPPAAGYVATRPPPAPVEPAPAREVAPASAPEAESEPVGIIPFDFGSRVPGPVSQPIAIAGVAAPAEIGLPAEWTPALEEALLELIFHAGTQHKVGISSEEQARVSEQPVPQPGQPAVTSPALGPGPQAPAPSSPAGAVTSPPGAAPVTAARAPGFWFQVNAELVIYGATEPNAAVTISGRPIRLRPDGTFSYRFSLPDGAYELDVQAVSVHRDGRRALLRFSRDTQYEGVVGSHPQDPALKPPHAANLP